VNRDGAGVSTGADLPNTQGVTTLPSAPAPSPDEEGSLASPIGRAATLMVAFLALLWVVQLINAGTGYSLAQSGGILPRQPSSLVDIVTSPFLHGSLEHLAGNALPLFSLGVIAAIPGPRRFLLMTLVVIVVGGFGVWLFSPDNSVTVGASGVVFGYFGYLLLRGLVDRRPADVVISVGIALAYGHAMWNSVGIGVEGVSWQGHVAGLVGGMVAALFLRLPRRRPVAEARTDTLPGLPPGV
jgi:membrane associated rhomboid family serine protease